DFREFCFRFQVISLYAIQMTTWNVLYSTSSNTTDVLTNLTDGLLTNDNHGHIIADAADEWGTDDDGLSWYFHIREGMTYVDYQGNYLGDVTAEDWLWGLEWVLNFWKNDANNTTMVLAVIEGAQDYYDYTKNLTQEEAWALDLTTFLEMVNVTAEDGTLTYHCVTNCPYFESICTSMELYPLAAGMVAELGTEGIYSLTYDKLWYCGPYTCTTYVQNNSKVLTKNESYWNYDNVHLFDTVTVTMVESDDVAWQLYQTEEIYRVTLTSSAFTTIRSDESNPYYDYVCDSSPYFTSNVMHYNYAKNNEDGTPDTDWNSAMANEAFRQSLYYGLDMTSWNETVNGMNPLGIQNTTFTLAGLCSLSDGTDYNDLVKSMLNIEYHDDAPDRLDAELANSYKEQAIEELTAQGVTFPITAAYYVSASNQTNIDKAYILQQIFSDCLGDDYVVLDIRTYVSSFTDEVQTPSLHSLVFSGWNTSINDPMEFLETMTLGNEAAYYAMNYCKLNDITDEDLLALFQEYTDMVQEAEAIVDDMDARYTKFAEAEAFMLNHALTFPNAQNSESVLTWVNDWSKLYAAFGSQKGRYINWETKIGGYTRAEYEELYAAWQEEA
ncbi:MAG: ABC transporter substrate-binding protein, partial [Clostridiales bacterium]|nr:ABC transporter substrate-binding protein [Clostridiales bacterium]